MGRIVDLSFITDIPGGGGDALFQHHGITRKVYDYEVNVFCSDGVNQGEWMGRVTWRWEKRLGLASRTTILSAEPKAKPTATFMDAVRSFCHTKGFQFPEVVAPTAGGTACQGEFCFPGGPQVASAPGRAHQRGVRR
jgi:hypothetical protein